jgi:SAM-dependent methyltransferase
VEENLKNNIFIGSHWFAFDEKANQNFWKSFGGKPSFQNATVLDVGCGRGSLCIDIALSGSKKISGIDLDPVLIEFARVNLLQKYPFLAERVNFDVGYLSQYPGDVFDCIVSKDTFEHIMNLGEVLSEMKRCLKPGGRIYTGFGPLYNAPDGPHGHYGVLPWGHVFLPERLLVAMVNRRRHDKIRRLLDLRGVNHLSFAEHRALLFGCGLKVVYFEVNQSRNPVSRLFSLLRKIPGLEEYFTHNIYCILEKVDDNVG